MYINNEYRLQIYYWYNDTAMSKELISLHY